MDNKRQNAGINTTFTITTESLSDLLTPYNTFKVTHSENYPAYPNPFVCTSINVKPQVIRNRDIISFDRTFVSPISIYRNILSASMTTINENTAIFTLHMENGVQPYDKQGKENVITIEAVYDKDVFVPTEPCVITDDIFKQDESIGMENPVEVFFKPEYFDAKRTNSKEGLYVIDPNRLGIMDDHQKYIVQLFISMYLNGYSTNGSKTICVWVGADGSKLVMAYDLDKGEVIERY